jgi:hypothetical protein
MTFMVLRRDATEVRSLTWCDLFHTHVSPSDHLLVGQPGTTGGVGLCQRCGDVLVSLTQHFGQGFYLKVECSGSPTT